MPTDVSENPTARATLVSVPRRYRPDVERWAVIVGISDYQHRELNLKWAHRDAQELHDLLLTPMGGSFAADHVQLLVNEAATTQAISRALRSFLKKPAKDDVVLIYFACHGGPDPDRPSNLYLLTHDTDPEDIAGTALPMREIDLSLRENLLAERVVVLADTCHSAGIGGGIGRRSVVAEAGVMNTYLDAMSAAKGGLALLTSAEANETSQEDRRWGDGHGVFTHYLLEGMRGAADGFNQPRDGKVAVGELFDYVRHQVQQATGNSQHPAIGTNPFDRDLPLAITGGIDAQQHLELGQCLFELARIADEPDRYRAAARQFEEALRLASLGGVALPDAGWRLAQAWLAAGDVAQALDELTRLREHQADELPPPALFTLGLAQAEQGNVDAAIASFREVLEQHPDEVYASWSSYCLALLEQPIVPRALLIGIGKHASGIVERIPSLDGPANDVALIKSVLTVDYGFAENDVAVLEDEQATWVGIDKALRELAECAKPRDPVVIYLAGWGFQTISGKANLDEGDQPWLLTHDGNQANVVELHERLLAIQSIAKILIVDGMPSRQAIELAERAGDYALFLAAQPGQYAMETGFKDKTTRSVSKHGVSTYELARPGHALAKEPATLSVLYDQVREFMEKHVVKDPQTPVLAGNRDQPAFRSSTTTRSGRLYALLSGTEQWAYPNEILAELSQAYDRFTALEIVRYAQAYLSFGRAFLTHGALDQAIIALTMAVSQAVSGPSLVSLGKAQVAARQYAAARDTFRQLLAQPSYAPSSHVQSLIEQAEGLVNSQRHALVVGIDRYLSPDIRSLAGAVNDARAVQDAVAQRLGFQPQNIVLLLDEEATRERVVAEFRTLAAKAEKEPALFYFGGYSSTEVEEGALQTYRTIVCADSRYGNVGDLRLEELAIAAKNAHNLAAMIDGRHFGSGHDQLPERHVAAPPAGRQFEGASRISDLLTGMLWLQVGAISIYGGDLGEEIVPSAFAREIQPQVHGLATYALLKTLQENDPRALTYDAWVQASDQYAASLHPSNPKPRTFILGPGNEHLFDPKSQREAMFATATRIELDPVYRAIELLRRQIAERSQQGAAHPDGWLSLGVAYGVLGDYPLALQALETAAAFTVPGKAAMNQVAANDVSADEVTPDISYHLGRLLLASQQDYGRAVSELRNATRQDPTNGRAFYYLGQAIQEMVRRETLAEVENAFSAYLAAGVPAGHRSEVVAFLRERIAIKTQPPTS